MDSKLEASNRRRRRVASRRPRHRLRRHGSRLRPHARWLRDDPCRRGRALYCCACAPDRSIDCVAVLAPLPHCRSQPDQLGPRFISAFFDELIRPPAVLQNRSDQLLSLRQRARCAGRKRLRAAGRVSCRCGRRYVLRRAGPARRCGAGSRSRRVEVRASALFFFLLAAPWVRSHPARDCGCWNAHRPLLHRAFHSSNLWK